MHINRGTYTNIHINTEIPIYTYSDTEIHTNSTQIHIYIYRDTYTYKHFCAHIHRNTVRYTNHTNAHTYVSTPHSYKHTQI